MSKSILVIETPNNCEECPFVRHRIDCIPEDYCTLDKSKRDIVKTNAKPNWCSLRDLPEKKEVRDFCVGVNDYSQQGYQQGWNMCISEILGEYN